MGEPKPDAPLSEWWLWLRDNKDMYLGTVSLSSATVWAILNLRRKGQEVEA